MGKVRASEQFGQGEEGKQELKEECHSSLFLEAEYQSGPIITLKQDRKTSCFFFVSFKKYKLG